MNDKRMFTNRPRSGGARKLWDWYIKQTGEEPRSIFVIRPGRLQREVDAASWEIQGHDGKTYLVFSLNPALRSSISNAIPAPHSYSRFYLDE